MYQWTIDRNGNDVKASAEPVEDTAGNQGFLPVVEDATGETITASPTFYLLEHQALDAAIQLAHRL